MPSSFDPLRLGASLYVPATHPDLREIGTGKRYPALRSVIACTEDAIHPRDLPLALERLAEVLPSWNLLGGPLRFLRVRNPAILEAVLGLEQLAGLTGFVIPKATAANARDYLGLLGAASPHVAMLTVETREVFGSADLERLRDLVLEGGYNVPVIRFGGNDLLSALGLRRTPGLTAYDTPLGTWIDRVVGAFVPWGFTVTAPVYEWMDDPTTLALEAGMDVSRGLMGKTAIHPAQIGVIEAAYCVEPGALEQARAILAEDAPAVFKLDGGMCEPATHMRWALNTVRRAEVYGVRKAGSLHMAENRWQLAEG
ncbi:HpcH/HpaI aldolase/citrate lyase family protein [Deinococcus hopiensis]|uniref:HpcH/HpaI aldolase/citrate lyase family protein n=1 Tax=Deinococcus hopiensis TaxID=309885 RepID=UPI0009FEC5A8|nr:HpcH/HpaI aldolase/citrate lyase family protein [Deinococcus hopiensis]